MKEWDAIGNILIKVKIGEKIQRHLPEYADKIKKRAVIETGISMGWEKYAGNDALSITINRYGASAPYDELAEEFGFTVENIVEKVLEYM